MDKVLRLCVQLCLLNQVPELITLSALRILSSFQLARHHVVFALFYLLLLVFGILSQCLFDQLLLCPLTCLVLILFIVFLNLMIRALLCAALLFLYESLRRRPLALVRNYLDILLNLYEGDP